MKVSFFAPGEIADDLLLYAVIVARYQGKWIFSRHRERSTWEIPGGHIEPGESADAAARRELYEETGAADTEISPVCAYGVERNGHMTCGMLFFAEISRLAPLPDSEICEITRMDTLPEQLTYPDIQPALYDRVQAWLNVRSGAGEIWDLYDARRRLTGRTHRRGDPIPEGFYHLAVHVWVQSSNGCFLLTKRSPNKGFPDLWECTGGSALAGEDSLTAAIREAEEETGLILSPENGRVIHRYSGQDYHTDVWLFRQDFDLAKIHLLEGETCDKRAACFGEVLRLAYGRELVPYRYIRDWMEEKCMISVRQAATSDAKCVADLAVMLWENHDAVEMTEEFESLMSTEDAAVFLLSVDGKDVGFAQCQLRRDYVEGTSTSPVGYLEGIYVAPEYRRRGCARRLLTACEQWSKTMGCREFASDCELRNEESWCFHIKAGFLEANRIICFTKKLG